MTDFKKDDRVEWDSHGGKAAGTVEPKIPQTPNGRAQSPRVQDEPQYLVKSEKAGRTAVHARNRSPSAGCVLGRARSRAAASSRSAST